MELKYYYHFITLSAKMHNKGGRKNMHVFFIVLYSNTVEHMLKIKFHVLLSLKYLIYVGPFVLWDCSSVFLIKYLGHFKYNILKFWVFLVVLLQICITNYND